MLVLGTQNNMCVLLFSNCVRIDFSGWKIPYFCLGFTRILGPIITSLPSLRSNTDGPWTRNAWKMGKTHWKWEFFILRNQSALKLKKVVYTTVYCTFTHIKCLSFVAQWYSVWLSHEQNPPPAMSLSPGSSTFFF